ncbi:MerR family transcriptional regulator [Aquirufa esocilacus]
MELTKQYYTISEVAVIFQVNPSKIRYWETQFPHLSPKRAASGIRKYTPVDIEKIKVLVSLIQERGMTIEGAKQALNFQGKEKNPHQNIINQLTDIRDFLQGMKADLDLE